MLTSEEIHPDDHGNKKLSTIVDRIGIIQRIEAVEKDAVVLFYGHRANVALRFVNDNILRAKVFSTNEISWEMTPGIPSVERATPSIRVENREGVFVTSTQSLTVEVLLSPFKLDVYNNEGVPLFQQKEIRWGETGGISIYGAKTDQSHFYGLGEKTGFLDKNGERYENWNSDVYAPHVPDTDALYQSIPYLVHFEYGKPAYGFLLDNAGKSVFDMSENHQYEVHIETGELDFYILNGPSLKELVSRFSDLVGLMSLPPKWAIGYQQSRYSYMNQEEVLEIARTFREKQIPCDVLYLDIHYMNEYRVFTWDPVRFPDPENMLKELKELGFRVVPIVDPGVKKDPSYSIYREGVENDYFCSYVEGDLFFGEVWPGQSAFPDFTKDSAATWWGEKHRTYVEQGIHGIWNDMNEPSVFNTDSKTMDGDVLHNNNGNPKTHKEWHNLYGMLMSKATFEGLKKEMNGERPFVLTRAGYTGIHRYAAVWTGDNRSYWEHMAMSMPMVLNLGLSGVAFTGPDIGGFSHNTSGELLARWTQMGALFPFSRNHSAIDTIRQEPWLFGEEVEEVCRQYLQLRYRLMPYMYSLFYEAATSGLPIIRPLILEYPDDKSVYNMCDQFLLGSHLLVAPIYRPGSTYRSVYLPEGTWIDYWTGKTYEGSQTILAYAPLDTMPIYVKAGAIIPEQPVKLHTGEKIEEPYHFHIYAGQQGAIRSVFYEDDGQTFSYQDGAYRLSEYSWEEKDKEIVFSCSIKHDGLLDEERATDITIHHFPYQSVNLAEKDGLKVESYSYDPNSQTCYLSIRHSRSFEIIFREGGTNE